jgi:1-acyl-sn-glycerol-3-phosphate acyltransferase
VPRTAEDQVVRSEEPVYRTSWARSLPVRAAREVVQVAALTPLLRRQVDLDVHGTEQLRELDGPVLLVANHSSHLDTAALLGSLPAGRRQRTAVAAVADYFFDAWWRAGASAVVFNTLPIEKFDGTLARTPAELLAAGWSIIVYPEGTRSSDGFLGSFRTGAARLAVEQRVPVVPVGLRGTYSAMPRGRRWPRPGRPRVSVRYGAPLVPGADETAEQLTDRIETAVRQLIAEDATSWWAVQRAPGVPVEEPIASWRRIWQQSDEPVAGGQPPRSRIWRG